MRRDDGLDDGQPQPSAFALTVPDGIDAVEAVEESRQVFGRELCPGILDGDPSALGARLQVDPYPLTARGGTGECDLSLDSCAASVVYDALYAWCRSCQAETHDWRPAG